MLTQKQENFTQNLFKGMTQREAWINAGYSSNYALAIVDKHACELAAKGKIKGRYAELIDATTSPLVADKQEIMVRLTEVVRDKEVDPVRASAELNKMRGDYAPDKHIIEGEILITPGMRVLAAKEMIEVKEEEAELLKEGKGGENAR